MVALLLLVLSYVFHLEPHDSRYFEFFALWIQSGYQIQALKSLVGLDFLT